ncbi:wax ester synthase/diacylglycerol acyltransferase 11-like [Hordeum vulgare subsp. vulgare]|uniref:wax ester synthase/diacylglycerol acyltransferase 11-like n=1 Tax=Hordeum vulgare subsp. vulgare TaxID=112509 RepID=UPI001D1A3C58|nr:wax ester synthase/diacylglycerol acyltransferase 11-like [Hordeum vulgare subsp. vulgare]
MQVMDELEEGAGLKWVRTTVELDDHIIVPNLDPVAMSIEPDRTLEDYLASLSTLPMDHSRPLWEFHVLDFPTSDATAALAFRAHHSLGDGASLLSLLIAAADPSKVLPTTAPRRVSTMKALTPRSPSSTGAGVMVVFTVWIVSLLLLVWHTVVDIVCFAATAISMLRDPPTLFKGPGGAEFRPKRFVNRMLSLDDIKYVKSVMCCTVNDVLLGVTSAALSRYYFRKTGESGKKNIKVRSTFIVNLRKMTGLHTLASMMKSGKENDVKWGNQLGYMVLPFHIEKHDAPLKYVEKAMRIAHRKKSSMESVFTNWSALMITKIFGIKVLRHFDLIFILLFKCSFN